MSRQKSLTIVEKAIIAVPEFDKVQKRLYQQVVLRGQSESTLKNYVRRITLCVLHFGRLPQEVCIDEINEYLRSLALAPKSPSLSSFKHMVYGVRAIIIVY